MGYKAIIWGVGETYRTYAEYIFKEARSGRMKLIGITGSNTIYKSVDNLPFLDKSTLADIDYDFIISAVDDDILPDIYHEASTFNIMRNRFIRADVFSLPSFNIEKYMQLRKNPVSIISETCFGGVLYHRLDLPFTSPTINLFFQPEDFIKFCTFLPEYINSELVFDHKAYEAGLKLNFPVMRLNDVSINFNHCATVGEAAEKWNERCKLINYDNILVVMYATEAKMLKGFENIPYRKCCFTQFCSDIPDTIYLPLDHNKVYWKMFNDSASGNCQIIDPLKFLLGESNYIRCEFV